MERKQFTFYESYAAALSRIKNRAQRSMAYDVIIDYALYGTEPDLDALPAPVAIAFDLIRPTLDTGRRRAENGAKRKQNENKSEQTESKQ